MTELQKVVAELERRKQLRDNSPRRLLFKNQLAVANDPSSNIACLCTRRAGKSYGLGAMLIEAAQRNPKSLVPYIALTRLSAENIMWPILKEIDEKRGYQISFLDSKLHAVLPNESRILLVGADQKNFIERLRGPKYPMAVIDEAQAFRDHVEKLVEDVLEPAVMDYQGRIILAGTPGPVCAGYFHEATTGKGWSLHEWSVFDNPHLPHAKEHVEKLMERKGWDWDHPTIRREWLGEWVEDLDALIYKFRKHRNIYTEIADAERWDCVLGVDYGFNDQTAFAVLKYHEHSPVIYVEYVYGESGMIPTDIAAKLQELIKRYGPNHIVADTGGLGKTITEEMIRRYHIPMQAATKTDKYTWIKLINGDFEEGNLQVHESLGDLHHQYLTLQKNEKGKEDESLPNDLCDAVLYAYRKAKAYAYTEKDEEPATEAERLDKEAERMLEQELAELERSENGEWWENI